MKKNIILIFISVTLGILCTFFILNKKDIYAKNDYIAYAFQIGAYSSYENALEITNNISSIILNENGLYKVYSAISLNDFIINNLLSYYQDKGINVYLKPIKVSQKFYNTLEKYEELEKKIISIDNYESFNQSILNLYLESSGE